MSVAVAMIGLAIGIVAYATFQRLIYPPLGRAHEAARVTLSQGVDPSNYKLVLQIICTLIFPAAGGAIQGQ